MGYTLQGHVFLMWCIFSDVGWLIWGLTFHQQQRSYEDGSSVYRHIRQTGEAQDRNWLLPPVVYKASDITTTSTP